MSYYAHTEESTTVVIKEKIPTLIADAQCQFPNLPHNPILDDVVGLFGFGYDVNMADTEVTFYYEHEKYRTDEIERFFELICPFVEPGGYISFRGEDDAVWAFYFDGESFKEYNGETVFPDMPTNSMLCMRDPKPSMPYSDISDGTLMLPMRRLFGGLSNKEVDEVFAMLKDELHRQPAGVRFSEAIARSIYNVLTDHSSSEYSRPIPGSLINKILSGC